MKIRAELWANSLLNQSGLSLVTLSTGLVVVAFALRILLAPELGDTSPFTFFVTASILSACFGGWKYGVYSMVLGFLVADWFFVPPTGTLGGYGKLETISLVSDFLPNAVAILGFEWLHQTRKALALSEAQLKRATIEIEKVNAELETSVRRRTAELQSSLNFLERFCYSIAHDLRAPLRAIRGMASALEEDYQGQIDFEGFEYMKRMSQAAGKMDQLITDLLDYGRLSHQELESRDIVISDSVTTVVSRFRDQLNQINAEVRFENLQHTVKADRRLLEDVIQRLLSNSIKFRKPETPLRLIISCEKKAAWVKVAFQDNGVGIAENHLKKIFGMFETLEPTTGLQTGAGLALVSKAIERMQGSVGVTSQPGEGSTFWFELPAGSAGPT